VIRNKLCHLDHSEADIAINYLILVGLKHYQVLYANELVDIPILEFLCGKYIQDLGKAAGKRSKKDPLPPSISMSDRQSRLDAMQHYPFADNVGGVSQVLQQPQSNLPKLLDMGPPARKRLIIKIFEEMRMSKLGLRMSDIPEALNRLGLTVSVALKKILARTDPSSLGKSIKRNLRQAPLPVDFQERCITQTQWLFIVRRLILLLRQGQDLEDIVHLFGSKEDYMEAGADLPDGYDEEDSDYEDMQAPGSGTGTYDDDAELESKGGENGDGEDDDDNEFGTGDDLRARSTNGTRSTSRGGHRRSHRHHRQRYKQQQGLNHTTAAGDTKSYSEHTRFVKNLKNVPSRIGTIVDYDKQAYKHAMEKRDTSALTTVAQRRVDALTSTQKPLGLKDRNYFSEPRLFHSKPAPVVPPPSSSTLAPGHSISQRRGGSGISSGAARSDYKRYSDLSTGMATMEIADSFLHGDIGKEIMSTSEPEYDYGIGGSGGHNGSNYQPDDTLDAATAQRAASQLLGLPPTRNPPADWRQLPMQPRTSTTGTAAGIGSGTTRYQQAVHKEVQRYNLGATSKPQIAAAAAGERDSYRNLVSPSEGSNVSHLQRQLEQQQQIDNIDAATGEVGAMHLSNYTKHTSAATRTGTTGVGSTSAAAAATGTTSTSPLPYGHRSIGEKRQEQALNDTAKRMYAAPGWSSTKGGWVADFGPPHTHTLYTGPEVNYASLAEKPWQRRKQIQQQQQEEQEFEQFKQQQSMHQQLRSTSTASAPIAATTAVAASNSVSRANMKRVVSEQSNLESEYRRNIQEMNEISANVSNNMRQAAMNNARRGEGGGNDDGSFSVDTAVAGAGEGNLRAINAPLMSQSALSGASMGVYDGDDYNHDVDDDAMVGGAAAAGAAEEDEDEDDDDDDDDYLGSLNDSISLSAAVSK